MTTFKEWRFQSVTLLICAYLLSIPQVAASWQIQMVLEALLLATVLVAVSANQVWTKLRRLLVALWLVSVFGTLLSVLLTQPNLWKWYRAVELLTSVPLLAAVAIGMLTFVRRERTLTVGSVFAITAAYIMLALLFTQIFLFPMAWDPASFSLPVETTGEPAEVLQADLMYSSLVTLATVGYGDIPSATYTARMLAMFQAVAGQFCVAGVVALFVNMYTSQRRSGGS